jgi:hypothetical protein
MCTQASNNSTLCRQVMDESDGANLVEQPNSDGIRMNSCQQTSEPFLPREDSLDFGLLQKTWPAKERSTFCKAMKVIMWQHLVLRGCARSELEMEFSAMVENLWNQVRTRKRLGDQLSGDQEELTAPKVPHVRLTKVFSPSKQLSSYCCKNS